MTKTKADFTDLSFSGWLDWSSWLFGFRVDWRSYLRYVVVEVGPFGFSIEVGEYVTEDADG